jgi:prevent-host-death family protein
LLWVTTTSVHMEVGIRELRRNLSAILDAVEAGEEVVVRRRGTEVARLVPAKPARPGLPSLRDFRARIEVQGEALSRQIVEARRGERY